MKNLIAKFLKCTSCRKLFTVTIGKKKSGMPVCPHCLKMNHAG